MLMALLTIGCVHTTGRNQAKWERATATALGISRTEVADIARMAIGSQKLFVVLMQKGDAGVIEVYLAETLTSGQGTVARFRKVGDRRMELQTGEIVKWVE